MGPFVGWVELVCGLFSGFAAEPLIVIIIVAIVSTKIPILLGQNGWASRCATLIATGFCA